MLNTKLSLWCVFLCSVGVQEGAGGVQEGAMFGIKNYDLWCKCLFRRIMGIFICNEKICLLQKETISLHHLLWSCLFTQYVSLSFPQYVISMLLVYEACKAAVFDEQVSTDESFPTLVVVDQEVLQWFLKETLWNTFILHSSTTQQLIVCFSVWEDVFIPNGTHVRSHSTVIQFMIVAKSLLHFSLCPLSVLKYIIGFKSAKAEQTFKLRRAHFCDFMLSHGKCSTAETADGGRMMVQVYKVIINVYICKEKWG